MSQVWRTSWGSIPYTLLKKCKCLTPTTHFLWTNFSDRRQQKTKTPTRQGVVLAPHPPPIATPPQTWAQAQAWAWHPPGPPRSAASRRSPRTCVQGEAPHPNGDSSRGGNCSSCCHWLDVDTACVFLGGEDISHLSNQQKLLLHLLLQTERE